MAKILLTTDEPVATGDALLPMAAEDVLAFEQWAQARGLGSLTNGEKKNLMDYLYFKWEQSRSSGAFANCLATKSFVCPCGEPAFEPAASELCSTCLDAAERHE